MLLYLPFFSVPILAPHLDAVLSEEDKDKEISDLVPLQEKQTQNGLIDFVLNKNSRCLGIPPLLLIPTYELHLIRPTIYT